MIEFCLSNSSFFYRYRCFDEWCSISANKAGAKGENRNNFNELELRRKLSKGQVFQVLVEK